MNESAPLLCHDHVCVGVCVCVCARARAAASTDAESDSECMVLSIRMASFSSMVY